MFPLTLSRLSLRIVIGLFIIGIRLVPCSAAEWKPGRLSLTTRWTKEVSPERVLPEYPRPQMVRSEWQSLNGLWDYAVVQRTDPKPETWQDKILVPFPIESALSGVMKPVTEQQRILYRRTFSLPANWAGRRVLLHFGAIDWEAIVCINGRALPSHRGGYDEFGFDITDYLHPAGEQELFLSVWDPTDGPQPHGKQTLRRGGMTYTPSSGIWQTVWLEPVSPARIEGLRIVPDLDHSAVRLVVTTAGSGPKSVIEAEASAGGKTVSRAKGKPGAELVLRIQQPRPWSPEDPFLYDLRVTLSTARQEADRIQSYFGLRKLSLGKDSHGIPRVLLNNKFRVQIGPLDQGFWPDGLYTAPTDEALRYDVEITRQLGFNATRKHVKIEPERWYYWCDRLGLMVWQDMPSSHQLNAQSSEADMAQFKTELQRMIDGRFNHPSIVMWVLFNEGWGLHHLPELTACVERWDPTRIINHESGEGGETAQGIRNCYDAGLGQVVDTHSYGRVQALPPEAQRAAIIGEYGGIPLKIPDHTWGAGEASSVPLAPSEPFANQYIQLLQDYSALIERPGLSGMIYTQLTDVENELNGLLTYDRQLKVDSNRLAAAHARFIQSTSELRRSR